VQKKLPAIVEHNNGLDHKGNENVVGGVGRLNFPVVTKSVTAKVKKVEIERAAFCDGTAYQQLLIIHVKQSKGIEKITTNW